MADLPLLVVDLGGTTLTTGFSRDGTSFRRTRTRPVDHHPSPEDWITDELEENPDTRDAEWILGVPGPCGREGVERTPNLPEDWSGPGLVEALETRSLRYRLENDAHLAALGLSRLPEAGDANPLLGVTLGTGIGAGIVVDGRILRGTHGAAAEVGHLTLESGGRECTCGKKGCFETYASARGLVETYRREAGEEPPAHRIAELTTPAAEEAFRRTGTYLGRGLALVTNVVDPERIFLTGGLAGSLDRMRETFRPAFEEHVFAPGARSTPIDAPETPEIPTLLGGLVLATRDR